MEWISVKDKLPREETYVLVCQKDINQSSYGPPRIWIATYSNNRREEWDSGEWGDWRLKEVTHWMPLPETP